MGTCQDSRPQKVSSTPMLLRKVMKPRECIDLLTSLTKNVILILDQISCKMGSSPVVPPSMKDSPIDSRKSLMPLCQRETWLKLLLPLIDTTPYGLVDQPSSPSQPSKVNGSLRKSTRRTVLKSYTESAFERRI